VDRQRGDEGDVTPSDSVGGGGTGSVKMVNTCSFILNASFGCQTHPLTLFIRLCFFYLHIAVDPRQNTVDFGVDARLVSSTAAGPPAGDAHQVPTVQ